MGNGKWGMSVTQVTDRIYYRIKEIRRISTTIPHSTLPIPHFNILQLIDNLAR